jgi:hypothetical protein
VNPLAALRAMRALADAVNAPQTFELRHPDGTVETRTYASLRSSGRPRKVRVSNRADLTDSRIIMAARSTRAYRKSKRVAR